MPDIDFVIAWVDGSDPEWRKRKTALRGNASADDREERYRDWGLLKYWFRGVEKFAPWVRKIWFICDQEPPAWLDTAHPKLCVVRHEDFLPDEYRPAFSSHPIELNLHRITGLSEQFVYFNDDTFLLKPVGEDFFFRRGLPCDCALLNTIPTDDIADGRGTKIFYTFLNNTSYINRDYEFRKCLKKNIGKWLNPVYGKDLFRNLVLCVWPRLNGTVELHLPQAFLKKTFEEAWAQDADILDQTSRHHFRDNLDVNQWFIRLHHIMEGTFAVRKPIRRAVFLISGDCREITETIRRKRVPMMCINDGPMDDDAYWKAREALSTAFEEILPDISSFEK